MASTVRSLYAQLVRRIDPRAKDGSFIELYTISGATNASPIVVTVTGAHKFVAGQTIIVNGVAGNTAANGTWVLSAVSTYTMTLTGSTGNGAYTSGGAAFNVGYADGSRFTKERVLDIYNEARKALVNALTQILPDMAKSQAVSGNIVRNTAFQFATGVATLPSGYMKAVSLMNSSGVIITILPNSTVALMRHLDSAQNPIVFEEGANLRSENGSTYVSDASNYVFRYYGVTDFTISDVTGGTVTETIALRYEPILLQLAEALAQEVGAAELNALATRLIQLSEGG